MKKFGKILVVVLMLATVIGACCAFTACNDPKTAEAVKVIDVELTAEDYAFCVNKSDTTLLAKANEFLTSIKADGTLNSIISSFFDGEADFTYTNPTSKDGCLVVATNAEFPPFEYYEGNKFTGIDMKIAKLLADYLGKPLYIDDMKFDAVVTSVKLGQADIGMAGLTVNEERMKDVNFTETYYTSAQVLVVKASDTTFDNCADAAAIEAILAQQTKSYNVGAQDGTTGYMYTAGDEGFGYDGFANLTAKAYTAGALAIKDVSNGKINAVVIDKQPAIMIAKSINDTIKK